MLCKYFNSKRFWSILIAVGIVTLIFGVVGCKRLPDDVHNMSMLMGMFSGMGGSFIVVGTIKLIFIIYVRKQEFYHLLYKQ